MEHYERSTPEDINRTRALYTKAFARIYQAGYDHAVTLANTAHLSSAIERKALHDYFKLKGQHSATGRNPIFTVGYTNRGYGV